MIRGCLEVYVILTLQKLSTGACSILLKYIIEESDIDTISKVKSSYNLARGYMFCKFWFPLLRVHCFLSFKLCALSMLFHFDKK